eukprot:5763428-Ditylum_brightwellii.AAC.1
MVYPIWNGPSLCDSTEFRSLVVVQEPIWVGCTYPIRLPHTDGSSEIKMDSLLVLALKQVINLN